MLLDLFNVEQASAWLIINDRSTTTRREQAEPKPAFTRTSCAAGELPVAVDSRHNAMMQSKHRAKVPGRWQWHDQCDGTVMLLIIERKGRAGLTAGPRAQGGSSDNQEGASGGTC